MSCELWALAAIASTVTSRTRVVTTVPSLLNVAARMAKELATELATELAMIVSPTGAALVSDRPDDGLATVFAGMPSLVATGPFDGDPPVRGSNAPSPVPSPVPISILGAACILDAAVPIGRVGPDSPPRSDSSEPADGPWTLGHPLDPRSSVSWAGMLRLARFTALQSVCALSESRLVHAGSSLWLDWLRSAASVPPPI